MSPPNTHDTKYYVQTTCFYSPQTLKNSSGKHLQTTIDTCKGHYLLSDDQYFPIHSHYLKLGDSTSTSRPVLHHQLKGYYSIKLLWLLIKASRTTNIAKYNKGEQIFSFDESMRVIWNPSLLYIYPYTDPQKAAFSNVCAF